MSEVIEDGTVEVRRNARLAAAVGVTAFILAALFLVRGGILPVVIGVVLLVVAGLQLWTAYDGRVPLMLVDEQGVRIRMGRTWRGMPWSRIHEVEHTPRPAGVRGWWSDGRLAVLPVDEAAEVAALEGRSGWHARVSERLYGVPFAVPLGTSTRVVGDGGDLTAALAALAGPTTGVVEIDASLDPEESPEVEAPAADLDAETGEVEAVAADLPEGVAPEAVEDDERDEQREDTNPRIRARLPHVPEDEDAPAEASPTPAALREPTQVVRVDLGLAPEVVEPEEPVGEEPDDEEPAAAMPVDLPVEDPDATQLRLPPVVDNAPADPVVGPRLQAARERIGLSVDQLADRTRIRPHVIEAIEVDDFGPCGGDFYARGHLRTLARVLGLEAGPLLAMYDERYADAPVDPRAVFQAELAAGDNAALRRMKGGPNWSVLVAAVMAVVLVWSVVRLATAGGTAHHASPAISLSSGSSGTTSPYGKKATPVPVTLSAAGGGAHVIVRDGSGKVAFDSDLAFEQTKTLKVSPPLRVQTSDGSLTVSVNGGPATAIGVDGKPAQKTYTAN